MNEQEAARLINTIDGCNYQCRRKTGTVVMDGDYTPQQLEAVGWWFQRHSDWPPENKT